MDKNSGNNMITLLQKYIDNKCTKEELYLLFEWLKSSENKKAFDDISRSVWERLDQQITLPDKNTKNQLNKEFALIRKSIRKNNKPSGRRKNLVRRSRIYWAAAICMLVCITGIGYYLVNSRHKVTYEVIATARGEIREHTLNDGTKIVLNAASRLTIPSDYNKNHRQIEMVGEGFFEVTPNPTKPFIIQNEMTQV